MWGARTHAAPHTVMCHTFRIGKIFMSLSFEALVSLYVKLLKFLIKALV